MLRRQFGGSSTLKLEDAFSGKIILLDIPIQTHEYAGRIAQALYKYTFQKAVEQRDLRSFPNPLVLWQDEAQAFLLPGDSAFMSTCRSSRVGSVLLSQNISNFYAALGGGQKSESQVNSLLALCNTKIFHANNDHVTNEWAAKTIGMGIKNLTSVNIGGPSESASSSQHMHYLVEPREFTMLKTGGPANRYLVDAV
ncbi:MAG: TraM recognition domain-containing protein, partial [Bacteroidetes bacterium]|nr:TraM recognition domain-containing protein [Bacteroidota bacterium]